MKVGREGRCNCASSRHVDNAALNNTYHRDTHSSDMIDATLKHERSEKIYVWFLTFKYREKKMNTNI